MLHLQSPTPPGWFDRIRADLPTILIDHAHLEKRAASTALSLIFRYPENIELGLAMSRVVREEMEHFEQMLELLERRRIPLIRLEPSPYAGHLVSKARKQEPETLLDRLLIAALIEARSCERFQLLTQAMEAEGEEELQAFYARLYRDEARHHTLYTGLARDLFGKEAADERLEELAVVEFEALQVSEGLPRLHSL